MKPVLRGLWGLLKPYLHYFLLGTVCTFLVGLANLVVYWIAKDMVDRVFLYSDQAARLRALNLIALGTIMLFALKGVVHYGQNYLMALVGQRVVVELRNRIFSHLQRVSLSFHESKRTGEMISRLMNDVGLLQNSISSGLAELLLQSVTLVGLGGFMFYLDYRLSLLTFLVIPAIGFVVGRSGQKIRSITGAIQSKIADITALLQETLLGIRVVKAFSMEHREMERFARENEQSFMMTMKSARVTASVTPIVEFLGVVGMTFVLWFGGHRVIAGKLTPGEFVAFLGCVGSLPTPMGRLSACYAQLQGALAACERIFDLLQVEADVTPERNTIVLPRLKGYVGFRNVSFSYRTGEKVLDGINLEVKPGEVVALVGPSGAGKTTLVNLLLRFYNPTSGVVEIDGYDISKVAVNSLRSQIGLVPQETILFGVTVRENIAYGKQGAALKEIISAAKLANAHDFIMRLPEGYETNLGERGITLSGGQRQRIAIARAILRDPRILILDEATSALDVESEALVQDAIKRLLKGRTTFIIAHRLSTIRGADKIVVLDRGRIVEAGSHLELLAKEGLYHRLYAAQFGEENAG